MNRGEDNLGLHTVISLFAAEKECSRITIDRLLNPGSSWGSPDLARAATDTEQLEKGFLVDGGAHVVFSGAGTQDAQGLSNN